MRIENRRSRIESVVTKEEWQQMKDQGVSALFRVLDKDDNFIKRVNIPREIQEFKLSRPERIIPTEKAGIEVSQVPFDGELIINPDKTVKPIKK